MKGIGRRRLVIWAAVGLVVAVLLALALAPRPAPADFEEVIRGPMQVTLDHEGKTRVRARFVISAPVDGRVQRIELEPGDPVVANETVLATFEPAEPVLLDARSRAEAEAGVRAARAALTQARAERDAARAESELADVELRRIRRLAEAGISSEQQLDSAAATARARRDGLEAAESAVETARHELEAAQARLMLPAANPGAGTDDPDRTIRLRSPVDGVVLKRLRESEATVPKGEPLLEVGDPANLEVVADFLSTDAVKMRPGMPVLIDRWGGQSLLRGRLRRVEPSGFMKISALGVEEQRVWVVADFDDPQTAWESLGDEYRVEVRVVVWESESALQLPTGSLFRHDGWAVFVVEDGRARRRPVEIGWRNGLHAEVLSGVEEGEIVIAHPSDAIADGVRVAEREG